MQRTNRAGAIGVDHARHVQRIRVGQVRVGWRDSEHDAGGLSDIFQQDVTDLQGGRGLG